ncbi:MAG TPA: pyrimidine reductase family protein [Streptosporangiaceae bacterium]|nr:pyrimidine reductase family protein [Streptosporangiaceae bacterium]
MRQIFPVDSKGGVLGPAEPLRLVWSGPPAADSDDPNVTGLIAELGEIYAFPDQPGPWVKANMITSVDGAISVQGRSGGLSGLADKLIFGLLRSLADVIVVGAQTARAERYGQAKPSAIWPQLRKGRPAVPPIAVVTKQLTLDLDSPLIQGNGGPRTIILTTSQAATDRVELASKTADVIIAGDHEVSATAIVDRLAELGHRKILVEGGPTLLAQLSAAGLLDELCWTVSPLIEGGGAARMMVSKTSDPPITRDFSLRALLEDDGFLLASYIRR